MSTWPAWIWPEPPTTHPWIALLHVRELEAYTALSQLWDRDVVDREHWRSVVERIDRVREAHAALERDLWMDAVRALGRGLRRIGAALEPREENVVDAIRARLRREP